MRITYVNYAISICARLSLTAYLLCIMQIKLCISLVGHSSSRAVQQCSTLAGENGIACPSCLPALPASPTPPVATVSEHGHHVVVPSVQIAAACSTWPAWLASHALSLAVVVLLNAE